jgi:hypothetical protein
MYYADTIGAKAVLGRLRSFQATSGDDFKPAALLEILAAAGAHFRDL